MHSAFSSANSLTLYRQLFRDRRIHAYIPTPGREKCVYARMPRRERRAQITGGAPYAAHRSDASRGTAIDGCLLQLTCERRAARTLLRASRWASGRRVHATGARTPDHLSPYLRARRRERYYPVMDAPSVRHREYLARHDHVDETPSSTPDDLAATRLNAPRRACGSTSSVAPHSSLEKRRDYVDRPPRKSEHLRMKRHKRMWPIVDAIRVELYEGASNLQRVLNQLRF